LIIGCNGPVRKVLLKIGDFVLPSAPLCRRINAIATRIRQSTGKIKIFLEDYNKKTHLLFLKPVKVLKSLAVLWV